VKFVRRRRIRRLGDGANVVYVPRGRLVRGNERLDVGAQRGIDLTRGSQERIAIAAFANDGGMEDFRDGALALGTHRPSERLLSRAAAVNPIRNPPDPGAKTG